jgi:hypothetical protein
MRALLRPALEKTGRPALIKGVSDYGIPIDETGTLVRKGAVFVLRRDAGGHYRLELQRVPVDAVEKRVRIVGMIIAEGLVSVDGVALA